MTIAASLMILVSLFSDRWLIGGFDVLPQNMDEIKSLVEDGIGKFQQFSNGQPVDKDRSLGLFLNCKKPSGDQMGFFFGECLPNLDTLEDKFMSEDDDEFPHAWKGAITCFSVGLGIMVMTVALSLFTPCLRHCMFCSIFTLLGVLQSIAAVLFTLGLLAYPAGWGSKEVVHVLQVKQLPYLPNLSYPGYEALPLTAVLPRRMQNWSSILGRCHWHGGELLGIMLVHTCTQSNTGGQGQVQEIGRRKANLHCLESEQMRKNQTKVFFKQKNL